MKNRIRIVGANSEELGRTLRQIREENGQSMRNFYKIVGVAPITIRNIELARARSNLSTLEAVVNGLGYRLDIELVKEGEPDE